jgi:hypothetical protein
MFSEMFGRRRDPERRESTQPNRILDQRGAPPMSWGPSPTGWYPDFNADRQGVADPDNLIVEPHGSSGGSPTGAGGGAVVPAVAVSAEKIDQHAYLQVAGTWTPAPNQERPTGQYDPAVDGPGAPVPRMLMHFYYRERGASRTAYMNVPDGRTFPAAGSQDGASTTWYQDPAAAMAPYNIDPAAYDAKHPERSTAMPDSLSAIPAGPAHGWSEIPVSPGTLLIRNQTRKRRQQQNVNQNRLANSTYAGQSYSQSTAHVSNPPGVNVRVGTGGPGVGNPWG